MNYLIYIKHLLYRISIISIILKNNYNTIFFREILEIYIGHKQYSVVMTLCALTLLTQICNNNIMIVKYK